MLAEYFSDIWVSGEISGLRAYPSGHLYFGLKDKESQVDCVCFRSAAESLKFKLGDGLEVVAHGRVEVYVPRGKYQLVLDRFEPRGLGALQKAFEQLKEKLEKEGLFRAERKKPLPGLVRVLGIVTSPAGAAIQDMLKTLWLHRARMRVVLYPAQVQGEGAAGQIAEGIGTLAERGDVEAIIIGRGGGSLEDLWPFNEEIVARAVAGSRVPVVSGVGHETDFTIADFVADVRTATPTAAAQLVARGWEEFEARLRDSGRHLVEGVEQQLLDREQVLTELVRHRAFELVRHRLDQARHRAERLLFRAGGLVNSELAGHRERMSRAANRLAQQHPKAVLLRHRARLAGAAGRLSRLCELGLARVQARLEKAGGQLDALSPLASLSRGYSVCRRSDGSLLRSVRQVKVGEQVEVRVSDGGLGCRVLETHPAGAESGGD